MKTIFSALLLVAMPVMAAETPRYSYEGVELPPIQFVGVPKIPVTVKHATRAVMNFRCPNAVACATLPPDESRCDVLLPDWAEEAALDKHPSDRYKRDLYAHELAHCNGWRHVAAKMVPLSSAFESEPWPSLVAMPQTMATFTTLSLTRHYPGGDCTIELLGDDFNVKVEGSGCPASDAERAVMFWETLASSYSTVCDAVNERKPRVME